MRRLGVGFGCVLWFVMGCGGGGGDGPGLGAGGDHDAGGSTEDGGDPRSGGRSGSSGSGGGGAGDAGMQEEDAATATAEPQAHLAVYWGDFETADRTELVVLDTGDGSKRRANLSAAGQVAAAAITPDGQSVIVAFGGGAGEARLMRYDVSDLESPVMLDVEDTEGGEFGFLVPSPDSSRVAYVWYRTSGIDSVVRVVDLSGDDPPEPVTLPADTTLQEMVISESGALGLGLDMRDGTYELWTATPGDGYVATHVDAPFDIYNDFVWDPADHLFFTGEIALDAGHHLYAFDAADGSVAEVSVYDAIAPSNTSMSIDDLTLSPDGRQLAFSADNVLDGTDDAFVLDLAAGELGQITDLATQAPEGEVHSITWRPDSRAILVAIQWESQVSGSIVEITLADASAHQIDAPVNGYQVEAEDFAWSPDLGSLYFRADARSESEMELFRLDSLEDATPDLDQALVQSAVPDGDVDGFGIAPLP